MLSLKMIMTTLVGWIDLSFGVMFGSDGDISSWVALPHMPHGEYQYKASIESAGHCTQMGSTGVAEFPIVRRCRCARIAGSEA